MYHCMDIKYVFFYNNVVSELRIRIVCLKPNRRERVVKDRGEV